MIGLPGFTAEAPLLYPSLSYHHSGPIYIVTDLGVQPQVQKGGGGSASQCTARCFGTWVGSRITCRYDKYPDMCLSIADNVYSRCLRRCKGLGSLDAVL